MAAVTAALIATAIAATASTVASVDNSQNAKNRANQANNAAQHDQDVADKKLQAQTLAADDAASTTALKARQRDTSNFTQNGTILTSPLGTTGQNQTQSKTLLGL